MSSRNAIDDMDARILLALIDQPRSTILALANRTGLARNTVQSHLDRMEGHGVLDSLERRIRPAALGYPLTAFVFAKVTQQLLEEVSQDLSDIPEVIEVVGIGGALDLLIRVAAQDADDLYRVAGQILATKGVERTETALAMRRMVDYRVSPLIKRALD